MVLGMELAATYAGLMLVTLLPLDDLTHSLLMNKPVGRVNLSPLGAVMSTESPDMALWTIFINGLQGM